MRILIKGEKVYDGTGLAPQKLDILVENGIITEVGKNLAAQDLETKDLENSSLSVVEAKVVCPGFIDIHRHADIAVFTQEDFGKTELLQGITSTVAGNCGLSPVPANHQWQKEYFQFLEPVTGPIPKGLPLENFHSYRQGLEEHSLPINIGFFAGSGAIKAAIKGFSPLPFNPHEMAQAREQICQAMDAGALGLSFGIMYQPECYSSLEELSTLASAAKGTLCFHIRGEGDSLPDSVEEAISIAEKAELPMNISHFKSTGIKNWDKLIHKTIEKIETARKRGLEITADFYPYDGGSTTIMSLLPPSFLDSSPDKSFSSLKSILLEKTGREKLRREVNRTHQGWDNMALGIGWDRIIISSVNLSEHESFCGRSMETIAREEGFKDPEELLAELIASEEGRVGIITLSMNQNDIETIARLPWTCLISDSLYSAAAKPHPRLNGAFPKFLREYVKEKRIVSMEEAIKKMTSMPAERMGIKNRGKIQVGYAADILAFDPEEFKDNADYLNSKALASGMDTVILNGNIVYNKGSFRSLGKGQTIIR